ncbi:MAG: hypothetical protein BWY47_00232 [Bacteroidetes bacterium ADurb.Bin302]|nr:MAG: hypothetical protein BWY47_00232 [Bacteroidetes bacterium ADurb.Bin302]
MILFDFPIVNPQLSRGFITASLAFPLKEVIIKVSFTPKKFLKFSRFTFSTKVSVCNFKITLPEDPHPRNALITVLIFIKSALVSLPTIYSPLKIVAQP